MKARANAITELVRKWNAEAHEMEREAINLEDGDMLTALELNLHASRLRVLVSELELAMIENERNELLWAEVQK